MRYMDLAILVDRSSNLSKHIDKINNILDKIYKAIRYSPIIDGVYLSVWQFPVFPGESSCILKEELPKHSGIDRHFSLTARGNTNPAPTIYDASEYVLEHYADLKSTHVEVAHPLMILISDGKPDAGVESPDQQVNYREQQLVEDAYRKVCKTIREYEVQSKLQMKVFGIGNADMKMLRMLTNSKNDVYDYTTKDADSREFERALEKFYKNVYDQTSKLINEGDAVRSNLLGDDYFTNESKNALGDILSRL